MPLNTKTNTQLSSSYPLASSNIESIDYAMFNFVNDNLNIYCDTNQGSEKVPVLFSTPERAFQIKSDPNLRTEGGRTLNLPLITLKRTAMNKNPENKGRYGVHIPPYFDYYKRGGSIEVARTVQQDKTKNFANSNSIRKSAGGDNLNFQTSPGENKNIVYESISIPMPTFVEVTYELKLFSEYQQQMNAMMEVLTTFTGAPSVFKIENAGNKYEAFMEPGYSINNNFELGLEERRFETSITTMVLGYLIGAGKNQKTPNVVIRESAAKIKIQRERSIVGDIPEFRKGSKDKYRP
jgi:hypothetical protein